MAALFTDQGRFLQKVSKAGYDNFITVCTDAPKPTPKLITLMTTLKRAEKIGVQKVA